jgi:hypothetical protein
VENCELKTELRGPRARIDQATAGFERPRVAITLALPHLRHRSLFDELRDRAGQGRRPAQSGESLARGR